jgi:hypothetical protein
MPKVKRVYGWQPDSDDPENDYLRALLLEAKVKKIMGKIKIPKKKVKK